MKKSLSWRPVRRGKIYCAPACGVDCTLEDYTAALRNGAKLARALGPGWKPRVWENCGWHFEAIHATGFVVHASVGVHGPASYWADMIVDGRQYHSSSYPSAATAVQVVVGAMRAHLARVSDIVDRIGNPKRRGKR